MTKRAKVKFSPRKYYEKKEQLKKIKQLRKMQEEEQKKIKQWINNNREFNIEEYMEKWEGNKTESTRRFVDEIIKAMSLVNAASDANELLAIGLSMQDVGLDLEALHDLEYNVFTVKMAEILVNKANFPKEIASLILNRVVSQVFPIRDNKIESPPFLSGDTYGQTFSVKQRRSNPIEQGTGEKKSNTKETYNRGNRFTI